MTEYAMYLVFLLRLGVLLPLILRAWPNFCCFKETFRILSVPAGPKSLENNSGEGRPTGALKTPWL